MDEKIIANLIGEEIGKADANFVPKHAGFSIGGVPPVEHSVSIKTFIDEDLMDSEEIWTAAGTPHVVFHLTGEQMVRAIEGNVATIKQVIL